METDKGTDIKNIDITLDKNNKNKVNITFQVETNQVTQKNTLTTFDFDMQIELNETDIKISLIIDNNFTIIDDKHIDNKFHRDYNSSFAHFMHELLNNKLQEDNDHKTLIPIIYKTMHSTFDYFDINAQEEINDKMAESRIATLLKLIADDYNTKYHDTMSKQIHVNTNYNEIKKLIDELSNKQAKGNNENIVNNDNSNGNNNLQQQLEEDNNNNLPECCNNCITGLQNLWNKIKCW